MLQACKSLFVYIKEETKLAKKYYTESVPDVEKELKTSLDAGLSDSEAKARLEKYGPNALAAKKKESMFMRFIDQFKDFMIIVLIIAAILSGVVAKEWTDAAIIMIVVILNAILGVFQEARSEAAIEALKDMATPEAHVRRNDAIITIPSTELVPGDIVLLEAGDVVPADLRLNLASSLKIEESALTGESVPVEKKIETLSGDDIALGDRVNMAYSNTNVTYGRGEGIVVSTGMHTEVGKIATMLNNADAADYQRNARDAAKQNGQGGGDLVHGLLQHIGSVHVKGVFVLVKPFHENVFHGVRRRVHGGALRRGEVEGGHVIADAVRQANERRIGDIGHEHSRGQHRSQGILVLLQYAHHGKPHAVQSDLLPHAVGIADQLIGGGLVEDADIGGVLLVGGFQPPAQGQLQALNLIVGRGSAVNGDAVVVGVVLAHHGGTAPGRNQADVRLFCPFVQIAQADGLALVIGNGVLDSGDSRTKASHGGRNPTRQASWYPSTTGN